MRRPLRELLRDYGLPASIWFDQSELRGGDSWDRKIREQIRHCALFIPIVSANTEARVEGQEERCASAPSRAAKHMPLLSSLNDAISRRSSGRPALRTGHRLCAAPAPAHCPNLVCWLPEH